MDLEVASGIPVFKGKFGEAEADRLLWRAGFGPKPGEAAKLAEMGLSKAVDSFVRPASRRLVGAAPHDQDNNPLAPKDAWGHDHLWWLDRMVRTEAPLIEKMTLIWHGWFATSKNGGPDQRLMMRQNAMLRARALGNFRDLTIEVTRDPAMIMWLNSNQNNKWNPNENYARELQELFCLGADRGYTESDVRNLARALTGFRNDWNDNGPSKFRYDPKYHDDGFKKIYGRGRRYDWKDAVNRVVAHEKHPSFFVRKLWAAFIPTAPPASTARALERLYVSSKYEVRPVVEAILRHPHLYDPGRRMVKAPVVQVAGMLRATGRTIDTDAWAWLCSNAGQMLFLPPNVAGWDETRWLDTATFRARWQMGAQLCDPVRLDVKTAPDVPAEPAGMVDHALAFWGNPPISATTRDGLVDYAQKSMGAAKARWEREQFPVLIINALRMLIATTPDMLTS